MKTRCRRCRRKIDFGNSYCETCIPLARKERKANLLDSEAEKILHTQKWRDTRIKVLQRDNGMCVKCYKNKKITRKNLQVHHIIKRTTDISRAFDLDNLVTVCRDCHEELELLPAEEQRARLGEFNVVQEFSL